jgi:hypothetical protein
MTGNVIQLLQHPLGRAAAARDLARILAAREDLPVDERSDLADRARALVHSGFSAGRVAGAMYQHVRSRRPRANTTPGPDAA